MFLWAHVSDVLRVCFLYKPLYRLDSEMTYLFCIPFLDGGSASCARQIELTLFLFRVMHDAQTRLMFCIWICTASKRKVFEA